MNRLILTLTVGLGMLSASPAPAEDASRDARMVELDYRPDAVYRIAGALRTATQIVFSPDEIIRHVAIGDSVGWEVAAEGSVLFLKPRERLQATNLLVVTERGGAIRNYAFELAARETGDRSAIAYQIRFRYPADVHSATVASLQAAARVVETRLVGLTLDQAAVTGPRNLAYGVQGASDLRPSEVSDNGRFTMLRFPGNQSIPSIYTVSSDGVESLAPFDVRGEFVVVHAVVPGLRLRRGRSVLCIFNEAYDPRGTATGTRTASPDVDRTVMKGTQP